MKKHSCPSIGQLDTRYLQIEDRLLVPPAEDWFDPTGGLPENPEDGDRYIAEETANGWTQDYIYEWCDRCDEWHEYPPEEGWMIWMLFELIFYVFFSGGWMEVGDFSYLRLDGSNSPMIGTNSTTFFQIQQADTSVVFNVDTINVRVGIGTDSPDSAFHIKANFPGVVGNNYAGQIIIQNPADSVFSNAVITAYESDASGNPDQQLWYLGSSSVGNSDIIFLNRRNSKLQLGTSGISRITILGNGEVRIGTTTNYLNISNTGVVTLIGSAKRWLAVRPDIDYTVITAQGKPTQVVVGVFHGYSMPVYVAGQNEELFFNVHVPGRWDEASNPMVHLLVALAGAEDVGDNFKFQISWEHLTEGGVIPATSHDVEIEQAVLTARNAQYSTYELQFQIDYDVDDPDNLADHDDLALRLRRIDATNPDITNEIIILDYHVEFRVDKMFDGDAV